LLENGVGSLADEIHDVRIARVLCPACASPVLMAVMSSGPSVIRTLRLQVKRESYAGLDAAATVVTRGMFRAQHHKGLQAGTSFYIVSERNTTRACNGCGALT
jgi:hypothetical protein